MNGEILSVSYKAAYNNQVTFNNKVDYCVGTGRMGLALQKEYYDQLKYVQDIIGFKRMVYLLMIWRYTMNMKMKTEIYAVSIILHILTL